MEPEIYKLLLKNENFSLMDDIIAATDYTFGSPASVEFNWDIVLEREEEHGDVVGFLHTHPFSNFNMNQPPSNAIGYSPRDYDTMCAWVDSFWKPLYCLIGRGEKDKFPTLHIFAPPQMRVACYGHIFYMQEINGNGEFHECDDYYKGRILIRNKKIYLAGYKDLLVLPGLVSF